MPAFSYNLPLGPAQLLLAIADKSCISDEAKTVVTVTERRQAGAYCHSHQGLNGLPKADPEDDSQTLQLGKLSQTLEFGFRDLPFKDTDVGTRGNHDEN